jgi:hypothetical protein
VRSSLGIGIGGGGGAWIGWAAPWGKRNRGITT